jgi:hypothetical protein
MTKPTGTNDLNSFELFVQRKKYKDSSYPLTSTTGAPTPFDLWYDKPLYGRINKKGQPIIVIEEKLKRVESAETDLFVLDFVADAFENFRNEFLFLNKENAAGTIFEELLPVKGWESSVDNREIYIGQLYDLYGNNYITINNRKSSILSFDDFLNKFYEFFNEYGAEFPLTLSNYHVSSFVSPLASGIMIELSELDHGSDAEKYDDLLQNANFVCYAQTAEKFGFKIDKNAPWRLIADLGSPYWEKNSDLTLDKILNEYYNLAYEKDIQLMKDMFGRFYYTFSTAYPSFTKYMYSECKQKTVGKLVKRSFVSKQQIESNYTPKYWLNYYINVMAIESGTKLSNDTKKTISARANLIFDKNGMNEALNYVSTFFKKSS